MLTNMIGQHYNHPSVIIWGLGNENDWPGDFQEFDEEKIRQFMSELNKLAHELDPTRKTAIRRCDFCKDIVDVYSPSIWAGWYHGVYTDYMKTSEREVGNVPHFFHAEWGGSSHARRHSEKVDKVLAAASEGLISYEEVALISKDKDGDWSENYICNLIDWHLKEQETMPWLTGSAFWTFKDFSTPLRPENPVPYVNQKGVVERDLTKKESYYVFQSYWAKQPMAHIYGHSWPIRWGEANEKKMIKVYSNCEEAELFLNGKSLGVKKRNSGDFPAAGLRWMVSPKEGPNKIRVLAKKGGTIVQDELTFHYQTEKWEKPVKMVLDRVGEHEGVVTVRVRFLDENGVLCLDAKNWVRFSLTGDGELMANLGTSTGSYKVQLYNGRALIRVKTRGGSSVVSVRSEGIPTGFLDLTVQEDPSHNIKASGK
jgi:beta-galactosidase